jgi:lysophospholipase L1-like esterase
MKTKMKLLSIGITIIIISLGITTFIQTMGNKIPASPIRVACVGDSITKGSGYTVKLQSLLGAAYSVANFGVDGSTVSLNSNRPYINQPECQKAEEFQPDIVVIMLGTNDANPNLTQYNDTFEDDYSKLVSSFQELESNPQIWVVKSPPIQNNSFDLSAPILTEDVIPHIENVANNLDLPTIDVYSALDNHPDYFTDGVHPDGDGATLIASTVCIAITPGEFY